MLDEWISRMASAKVLMGDREARRAELSGWLDLIERAAAGEAWAEQELHRLVAVNARNLGAEGRPASAALMQVILLEESLEQSGRTDVRALTRPLLQLVADSHGTGATQRLVLKHRSRLARISPVVRLGDRAVVGFLLGGMEAELVDALFSRVLRECFTSGAEVAIVDLLGADPDDDLLYRTIVGMQSEPPGDRLRLVLTGLNSRARTEEGLVRCGADMGRIDLRDEVSEAILDLTQRP